MGQASSAKTSNTSAPLCQEAGSVGLAERSVRLGGLAVVGYDGESAFNVVLQAFPHLSINW